MQNLKQETLEILAKNGKTAEDVLWIGLSESLFGIDAIKSAVDYVINAIQSAK